MSEYTRELILKLIEENGGPEGLDLSGKDLSDIDLSREAIAAELEKAREKAPGETPVWYSALTGGILLQDANLQEADLMRANLQGANLGFAKLQGARLRGANLRRADLGLAKLQGGNLIFAKLQGANLALAELQEADLGGANLQRAYLGGANFQGAKLFCSRLEKVDFSDANAKSLEGAYFYNAFLDNTRMRRDQLGEEIGEDRDGRYEEAKEAYLALKNNFAEIGRYNDAAWAYCRERRMEKLAALQKAKEAWQKRDWKGAIPRHAKVAGDQLVEWVCDYGEGLGRVAGSLIAVWMGFALIYGLIAGVWGPWQDTGSGKIRYITRNPIDLLSFSLRSITTFAPIELEARSIPAMRILMPLEALLSIFLAGLLGFVAGNRIRRA